MIASIFKAFTRQEFKDFNVLIVQTSRSQLCIEGVYCTAVASAADSEQALILMHCRLEGS